MKFINVILCCGLLLLSGCSNEVEDGPTKEELSLLLSAEVIEKLENSDQALRALKGVCRVPERNIETLEHCIAVLSKWKKSAQASDHLKNMEIELEQQSRRKNWN